MDKKTECGIALTLLLIGTLTLTFSTQRVESSNPPATEWIRTYGGGKSDWSFSVVETND